VAASLLAATPSTAGAQAAGMPQIPQDDFLAGYRVEQAIYLYYHFMTEWDVRISPYDGACSADLGDLCLEGDWESQCELLRCHTRKQQAAYLEKLSKLARRDPHSPFAVGQAVTTAFRLQNPELALELAEEICTEGTEWWCQVVRGYALHRAHRSAEAEPFLRRGLEAAPLDLRCRLEDIFFLLPREIQDPYDAIPCDERGPVLEYFWWLADPFFADPGNDRWAEHISRRWEMLLHEQRMRALRVPNGLPGIHRRSHEIYYVLRGPHDSWAGGTAERGLLTSKGAASTSYAPKTLSLDGLDETLTYELKAGELDDGYTRLDGPTDAVQAQTARFREGDSLLVAVAGDLSEMEVWDEEAGQVVMEGGPAGLMRRLRIGRAHFVASENPGHVVALDPVPIRDELIFAARLANRHQLVGLEALTPGGTGRYRAPLQPLESSLPGISDLLLFRPLAPDLPETRMGAIGTMLPRMTVPADEHLGVYVELYGIDPEAQLRFAVHLEPRRGLLGRLGHIVGLGGDARSFEWTEPAGEAEGEGAPLHRAVNLQIGNAGPGDYDLSLEVGLPDGTVLLRSVEIRIQEGAEGEGGP